MIKKYYFLLVIILLQASCSTKETISYPKGMWFLNHTKTTLQINQKNDFLKATNGNLFWKNYMSDLPNNSVKELLHLLPNSLIYWITYADNEFYVISSETSSADTLTQWQSKSNEYFTRKINSEQWYCKKIGGRYVFSKKEDLDNFFEEEIIPLPSSIEKLNSTIDTKAIANLFIEKSFSEKLFQSVFHKDITQGIGDWVALDVSLNQNSIQLNGASVLMKNINKVSTPNPIWKDITPAQISQMASYKIYSSYKNIPDFAQFIYGVNVIIYNQQNKVVVLNSTDTDATLNKLPIISEHTLDENTIYELPEDKKEIELFLNSFNVNIVPCLVVRYNEYLILSENEDALISFLDALQRNLILSATDPFHSLEKRMSTVADQTFITSFVSDSITQKEHPDISKKYALASLQISSTNNLSTFNFVSEESANMLSIRSPKKCFALTIEDSITSTPKIVENHINKKKEIIFQNSKKELVLIENNGKILFKKELDSSINSSIYQVDLFRNGKLQYAFTTTHSLWIIDRNGNEVAPFPKTYKGNLSPLEVISYGRNYDYRFATVEDSLTIHLIDNKGKTVMGFVPPKLNSKILKTPKHFIINSKDYLVFPTKNGSLKILHRDGRIRIPVTEKFNFSNNPISVFKEEFSFTTTEGKIANINSFGNIKYESDSLGLIHRYVSSKNFRVYLSGTTLTIGEKTVELPNGNYQLPKIYHINSSVLISIFDKENKKIYLYNQKGNLIPYFPMTSFSDVDIALSSERKIIIAITPEPNTISLLELN